MREKITKVYTFDELSDAAKEKAIENLWDINVNHDWWGSTYEDAEEIGCVITEFDINRGSYCKLVCRDPFETAQLITKEHGDTCDTYKLAEQYLKDHDAIIDCMTYDAGEGRTAATDEQLDKLKRDFQRALGEEYLSLLRREYEYQTSEEQIIESIQANEYEFTEDGKLS